MRISWILFLILILNPQLNGWDRSELVLQKILLVEDKPDCCLIENRQTKLSEYFRKGDYLHDDYDWTISRILQDRVEISNQRESGVLYLKSKSRKSQYLGSIDSHIREQAIRAQIKSLLKDYKKNYVKHPRFRDLLTNFEKLVLELCTQIETRMGVSLPQNVIVEIVGDDSIFGNRIAGNYAGEAQIKIDKGTIKGKILLNIKDYCENPQFDIYETLGHELAHIYLASIPRGHLVPRFMHEGIANYCSSKDNTKYLEKHLAYFLVRKKVWSRSVDEIIRPFKDLFEEEFYLNQDYLAAHLLIMYLVEKRGEDSLGKWINLFSIEKKDPYQSLYETAGFSDEDALRKDLEKFSQEKMRECFSKSPLIHYYMGNHYFKDKEYFKAKSAFEQALKNNPSHGESHYALVAVYSRLAKEKPDELPQYREAAIMHAQKAVQTDPENPTYIKLLKSFKRN